MTRTVISVTLLFLMSGTAECNCMNIEVPASIGTKTFPSEEIKTLELRFNELCTISTTTDKEKKKLQVIAFASILKIGICNGNTPLNNLELYKDDSLRKASNEDMQLFCANTKYENYESLFIGVLNFYKSLNSYDKDATCKDASQLGESDSILQSFALNAFGINKSPSFIKMKDNIKSICQDLVLNKISLDQAHKLIKQEKSFFRSIIESEAHEHFTQNIYTSFKTPFIFLGWLIGIAGGAIGIFLSIKKLT
ncbi:hypothetical protein MNBD_GAMMA09-2002 [hydrothermal vent metagenome]|uniref:Transmembrane protein n=1 Tax=hydrothermal vent metagenome TaxID=652676 RepID=A0A3B0XPF2_9ZZZZ